MAITDKITAIADAIRSKTNTSRLLRMDEMPALITSIAGEGVAEYVNFYDYDGTLLHQYTTAEFAEVTKMPKLPDSLTNCECVGWNYDLETIKALGCHVNVAAIYKGNDTEAAIEQEETITVDGTKLYFSFDKETTITFYYRQSKVNGVTIDWGDGARYTNGSYSGGSTISTKHTYQKGDYVMSFVLGEGVTLSLGYGNTSYSLIASCSFNATTCPVYLSLKKAEIDNNNTIVLSSAFRYCIGLKEVIFGEGTNRSIPTYAFDACYALEKIHFSQSITSISDYAFRQCYRLHDVVIPTSVTQIGNYVFSDCRRLYSVKIPGTVKTIYTGAFQNCTALTEVVLGNGIKTLSGNTFYGCNYLPSITLPNSITSMGTQVFHSCYALNHIVLPTGITAISNNTFSACYSLRTVVIHEGINSIGSGAFSSCYSLRFVGLPRTLRTINSSAFNACYHLQNAVMPEGVTTIGSSAFVNTYALEYISIPSTITSIGTCAFQNCKGLKNILIPTQFATQTGFLVSCNMVSEKTTKIYQNQLDGCTSIQSNSFQNCQGLEDIEIPENITSIGNYAFAENRGLKSATLPLGITSIGTYAFQNCGNIDKITLPRTTTSVGSYAFSNCNSLKNIDCPATVSSIGSYAFQLCYNLEKAILRKSEIALNVAAFRQCYRLRTVNFSSVVKKASLYSECFAYSGLRETPAFPEDTTMNDTTHFAYCYALQKADLSNIINSHGSGLTNCFICDYALSEVKFPKYLAVIGSSMFQQNYALAGTLEFPQYMSSIGSRAYYQCYNLTDIKFLGSYINIINSEAFAYCYNLREVHIPQTVMTMYKCFNGCYGIRKIYMYPLTPPTGTTTIGDFANDYTLYVPRGSLAAYKTQFTSHASRMQEFDYFMPTTKMHTRTICISDTSLAIKNALVHTELPDGATFTVTCTYDGQNLLNIHDAVYDLEANTISFAFDRAENMDFSLQENMNIRVKVNENDLECDIPVILKYRTDDVRNQFEVAHVSGYRFTEDAEGFYVSGNKGVNSSYSLCRVYFTSGTGKLYLDCNGQGETNCDFGLVSHLDVMLGSNSSTDSATYVKKSFVGLGTYNQVVEFDVPDNEEHFITCKYRKDGSVHSGLDRFRFRVRFE